MLVTPRMRRRRLAALAGVLALAGASGAGARGPAPMADAPPASLAPVATTVGLRVVTFVDHTRVARFHGGRVEPRTLVTQIRYPAAGSAQADDVPDAPPLSAAGPYPLVVFGHGFAVTPDTYERLLDAWARAGYIVAAPLFPLTQKHVPGGRRERDLIKQPGDMSFVISRMLADNANPSSFLFGLIDPNLIAVAGQSDGAATALAETYDPAFADPRIRAAIVMSGAELDSIDGDIAFPSQGPALLATQGTADAINEPDATYRYFQFAPTPKYLLRLIGATHLPPYRAQEPYLGVVERVTVAFLDHILRNDPAGLALMREYGNVPAVARLTG